MLQTISGLPPKGFIFFPGRRFEPPRAGIKQRILNSKVLPFWHRPGHVNPYKNDSKPCKGYATWRGGTTAHKLSFDKKFAAKLLKRPSN
jgi:hypothetical protein